MYNFSRPNKPDAPGLDVADTNTVAITYAIANNDFVR